MQLRPADFGLAEYAEFRPGQAEAVQKIMNQKERFLLLSLPTGVGKSLAYIAGCIGRGGRTVIVTSTKALQDQLAADFSPHGLVEVRGMANYRCLLGAPSCEQGPCHFGKECVLRDGGCFYFDAVEAARKARMVVTNYAYWLASGDFLGRFDNLVLDEAHKALDHLAAFLTADLDFVSIARSLRTRVTPPHDIEAWHRGLTTVLKEVVREENDICRLAALARVKKELDLVGRLLHRPVVVEKGRRWKVGPEKVVPFVEPFLFRGTQTVVLTSGTLTPHHAESLGITNFEYWEADSPFPVENRPVYWVRTGISLRYGLPPGKERLWLNVIDRILEAHPHEKGIIHTVSYGRAETILGLSRYKARFIFPASAHEIAQAVAVFKNTSEPKVLISPAVNTGLDFPGDECRFQIIAKVPFPVFRGEIFRAREAENPELRYQIAWRELIQACGRGVRSAQDYCKSYIPDDAFRLLWRCKYLAPHWFIKSIKEVPVYGVAES